jgi:hypothetical protein
MQVLNRKMMTTCPFEDYLRIPAWSYSGIKLNGVDKFEPTAKMMLGTHVHNYLLTPKEYKYDDIAIVKPIAIKLKETIGERLLQYCEPEMVVTADFVHDGFRLKYKGRIDLGIFGKLVIDCKITELDIRKDVEFFGYDKQQSGYALGIDAKMYLIVAVHPKKLTTQIYTAPIRTDWWEHHTKQKGDPIL